MDGQSQSRRRAIAPSVVQHRAGIDLFGFRHRAWSRLADAPQRHASRLCDIAALDPDENTPADAHCAPTGVPPAPPRTRADSKHPHSPPTPDRGVVAGRLAADCALGLGGGVVGPPALVLARLPRLVTADDELARRSLDAVVERLGDG